MKTLMTIIVGLLTMLFCDMAEVDVLVVETDNPIQGIISAANPGDIDTLGLAHNVRDDGKKAKALKQMYYVQVPFVENLGQIKNKNVRFYAKTFGGTVFVENTGALTYNLPAKGKGGVVIKEIFAGNRIKVKGLQPSSTKVNYFIGKEKRNWKANIPTYESISLGQIRTGINLTLKAYGNNVEKLFVILPEANPEAIRIKITGAKGLKVNNKGQLEVITEIDRVRFTRPVAYQQIKGERKTVEVSYIIYDGDTYGFNVGAYDKKRPLIIDPLLASTFIGGGSDESARSVAIDGTGHVYVAGHTNSSDYPTSSGAYDSSFNGICDLIISKFDSSLSTLLASTFIGGSGGDYAESIAIDGTGDVYVAGYTTSIDYPTTPGAYDVSSNGDYDVFIAKFDSSLSTLLSSTFIGGERTDAPGDIAISSTTGDVCFTGETLSANFPVTSGAYDEEYTGTESNVFVSRLDSTLSNLVASTYIGGGGWSWANGTSIAIDGLDNVYITGGAGFYWGTPYPTTPGAYDPTHNGDIDFFVSKFDPALTSLEASTFIGGIGRDVARSIAIDGKGYVYIVGATPGFGYPTTPGAYDESYNGGYDVSVSKLDSSLSSLEASTFIGGENSDQAYSFALDGTGNVYVAGHTSSIDYPTTPGAYDESYNGGEYDFVVSRLDSTLSSLLASTFIGGSGDEIAGRFATTIGESGNVYVVGGTMSSDFPTTSGSYDENHNGGCDVFVSKLDSDLLFEAAPIANAGGPYIRQATSWSGASVELDGTGSYDPDGDALTYEWDLDLSVDSDSDGDPANDVDATGANPEALFPMGQTEILLVVVDEFGWLSLPDVTTVTVSFIEVGVEIRIDNGEDTINVNSEGVVRVTFLTDLPAFDALVVDPNTVTLRGEDFEGFVQFRSKNDTAPMVVDQDYDDDGDIDRVVNLDTERLTAGGLDAYCEIGALTYDGYVVLGVDIAHLAPVVDNSE